MSDKIYTIEDMDKMHKSGFKAGEEHSKPSPITHNLINKMTEQIKNVEVTQARQGVDISYIKEAVDKLELVNKEQNQKMDDFIKCADKKYAPAWAADAIKFLIATTFGAIVLAILSLIIK